MEHFVRENEFRNESEFFGYNFTTSENASLNASNKSGLPWNYYYYYLDYQGADFNLFDLLPQSYRNARVFLLRYLVVIIWILSVLGNSLVIVVLTQKKNRNFSTSIYLGGLAVADLSLNTSSTFMLYFLTHGYIRQAASNTDCKYRNIFQFAISFITTWMLVVVSIERVISVLLPHKVKQICTPKVAYIVTATVWIFFFIVAFLHEQVMNITIFACQLDPKYAQIYVDYLSWVIVSIKFFLTYTIICMCSIIIVITLLKSKAIGKHNTQKGKRRSSVNAVMLSVNIVFLITNSPYIFYYCFVDYGPLSTSNLLNYAYYLFWLKYTQVLSDLNCALNVFVYFLVGSRFRADVLELFSSCVPRWNKNREARSQKTQQIRVTASSELGDTDRKPKIPKAFHRQDSEFVM